MKNYRDHAAQGIAPSLRAEAEGWFEKFAFRERGWLGARSWWPCLL